MASVASTQAAQGGVRFSADFISHIPRYQQAIRRQPVMGWARERGLDEDLAQLALIDLARVDARYDASRATSPHHFRLAVLSSRVSDCANVLKNMYREVTGEIDPDLDPDDEVGEDDDVQRGSDERAEGDPVLERAMRAQIALATYLAIKALPARQREVIELQLEDMTDKEIAEQFGVTVQAVNKTKLAAIANLRQVVGAQFATS
jgi:RNA polymerase sigma factor (sigma-70 family)